MTRWSSPSRAVRCASPLREPHPCPTPHPRPPPRLSSPPPGSYVLTLITDGMRSVRAFHFDKAAASVLTTSVSPGRAGGGERPWGRAWPPPHRPPAFRWSPWSLGTCSSALAWATRSSSSTQRSCRRPLPAPSGRPTRCVRGACRDTDPGAASLTGLLTASSCLAGRAPLEEEASGVCSRLVRWGRRPGAGGGRRGPGDGGGLMRDPASAAGGKSAPQDEVDEIEVYGSEAQSGTQLATYSFEVSLGPQRWAGGAPTQAGLPEQGCVCRSVTASSTSDPVPTRPWESLPSSPKRCLGVEGGGGHRALEPVLPVSPCAGQWGLGGGRALSLLPAPVQFQNSPEPDLEIVVCSGYGKNGALSVLQVRGGRGCCLVAGSLTGSGRTDSRIVAPEEYPAPGGDDL